MYMFCSHVFIQYTVLFAKTFSLIWSKLCVVFCQNENQFLVVFIKDYFHGTRDMWLFFLQIYKNVYNLLFYFNQLLFFYKCSVLTWFAQIKINIASDWLTKHTHKSNSVLLLCFFWNVKSFRKPFFDLKMIGSNKYKHCKWLVDKTYTQIEFYSDFGTWNKTFLWSPQRYSGG